MTGDNPWMEATPVHDQQTGLDGIKVIKEESETTCKADSSRKYSFSYEVLCDESVTFYPTQIRMDTSDACAPTMVVKHAAGCPVVSFKLILFVMGFILVAIAFCITKMPVSILYLFIGIMVQLFTFSVMAGMYFKH
eukprot:CAMPEP_0176341304 /NCGR_PEP_ID=MMETSP0126-20121128/2275_1 /TAXON_ID=141414 ORGANISM="Strombidinopsis acuminatum, Strain SPMC142" /NCGR_SAMPLE_ID=MMETSP0126 /ASSEMBLY_ACC=CAM_ASM_000229 /LENGTH=135 /DNA_ID=CAMNT_0017686049 /DNA_START=457 /DNA_END=864 /DNA_ORIENTATION=-